MCFSIIYITSLHQKTYYLYRVSLELRWIHLSQYFFLLFDTLSEFSSESRTIFSAAFAQTPHYLTAQRFALLLGYFLNFHRQFVHL